MCDTSGSKVMKGSVMVIPLTAAMVRHRALLLSAIFCCVATIVTATTWAAGAGDQVVLTIAGDIAKTNRGATDDFAEAFFRYHDITFARAFEFTRRDLERLGAHELTAKYPGKDLTVRAEGPRLSAVLDAVRARGTTATIMAFDGYATEIPLAELRKYPVVLALNRDGRDLGIGGRGPAWVVYPTSGYPELAARDDARWVWSAFFIRVE